MDSIQYGRRWFRAKKALREPLDEATARDAHKHRQPYAAAVYRDGKVVCFVEVNNDTIGVGIMDEFEREYLSYQFQEREPNRLFLNMAVHRNFDDLNKLATGTSYHFKINGVVFIHDEDFVNKTESVREKEAYISKNWESYPEFGKYDSLIRAER